MLKRSGKGLHGGCGQLESLDQRTVGHQMSLPTSGIQLTKQRLPVLSADGY